MSKYRVVESYGKPRVHKEPEDYMYASELKEEYGLEEFTVQEVDEIWREYSDSMAAGWMIPNKESVESVFRVELEAVNTEEDEINEYFND